MNPDLILIKATCMCVNVDFTNQILTMLNNSIVLFQAKKKLLETIDSYIKERILLSAVAISKYVQDEAKIKDGDVILVYSW